MLPLDVRVRLKNYADLEKKTFASRSGNADEQKSVQ